MPPVMRAIWLPGLALISCWLSHGASRDEHLKVWWAGRLYFSASCVLSHFSRVRLCDPVNCSLPGSSVLGILQAGILKWVAISSSRGSSRPRNRACISCIGRWILNHWTTWEVLVMVIVTLSPNLKFEEIWSDKNEYVYGFSNQNKLFKWTEWC